MTKNNQSDEAFLSDAENCTLDPKLFDHEAHLRLAWIMITRFGLEIGTKRICKTIKTIDKTFGDGTKYHETLTIASMHIVEHFNKKGTFNNFSDLTSTYPRLLTHFKDILGQHYKPSHLFSSMAKKTFVKPDVPFV